tara:strand:- start:1300 stop:1755 length:456 start_codon:yes stop_codon:yes gene_type:complete
MTIARLTSAVDVVRFWDVLLTGLKVVALKSNEPLDEAVMLKTVLWLVNEPAHGYVNIAYQAEEYVGFSIWQDSTPPFVTERSFIARAIYSAQGSQGTVVKLLADFEQWAQAEGIHRFIVSTRRHSGAAIRHFQSPKYGFTKGAITFEKIIK